MTTLLFERMHNLLILVHGPDNPSDVDWNSYASFVRKTQAGSAPLKALLVWTEGGAPNAMQRKAVLEATAAHETVTCVCTNSVVVRGVITALGWVSKARFHAFDFDGVDRALDTLEVPVAERAEAKRVLSRLRAQLSKGARGGERQLR